MVAENNTQAIDDEAPIGIGSMDFEFMTADDPEMQPYHMMAKMQQNLTPEELEEMQNLMPAITRFSLLYYKAETGEFPREPVENESGELRVQEQGEYQGISIDEYNQLLPESEGANLQNEEQNIPINEVRGPIPEPSGTPPIQRAENQQEMPLQAAEGGQVPQDLNMPQNTEKREEIPLGPVGEVQVEGKDTSGVADDVKTKSDGYVLSKGSVITNGKMYIMDLIDEAIQRLREKGVELDPNEVPESAEEILVSNGEIIIPHVIAEEIGYARLEKMNKRGEQITEELIAEKEQQQQPQQNMPGFNEGGDLLTGQEQYAADMQERVALREEVMKDADEVIFEDVFPAESPHEKEKIYQYPREKVKQAIKTHEWRNQEPKYAFVGLSGNMRSSAYGPGQMTYTSLKNMSDEGIFGDGKLKQYADKIVAAQTLFINHWVNNLSVENYTNRKSGKEALKTLGITREQYENYLNKGYFTPSNNTNAKDEGIPREVLGQNAIRNYDYLWDAFINNVLNEGGVTGINTFLTAYHGGTKKSDGEYVQKIRKILDSKKRDILDPKD